MRAGDAVGCAVRTGRTSNSRRRAHLVGRVPPRAAGALSSAPMQAGARHSRHEILTRAAATEHLLGVLMSRKNR